MTEPQRPTWAEWLELTDAERAAYREAHRDEWDRWRPKGAGGPSRKGMTYLVGEHGPETFIPHRSGQIVPNNRLTFTGPVSVEGSSAAERMAHKLAWRGRSFRHSRSLRRSVRKWLRGR